jgi:hypothetical protein
VNGAKASVTGRENSVEVEPWRQEGEPFRPPFFYFGGEKRAEKGYFGLTATPKREK